MALYRARRRRIVLREQEAQRAWVIATRFTTGVLMVFVILLFGVVAHNEYKIEQQDATLSR